VGRADESAGGIAVDDAGTAYVTGITSSTQVTFPVRSVRTELQRRETTTVYVAKVNTLATGALGYCGYIAGQIYDWGKGVAGLTSGGQRLRNRLYPVYGGDVPVTVVQNLPTNGEWECLRGQSRRGGKQTGSDVEFGGYVRSSGGYGWPKRRERPGRRSFPITSL